MSDGFDFSHLHTAAGQAIGYIAWSNGGEAPENPLTKKLGRVRELTAPDHTRTPDDNRELLGLVTHLQGTELIDIGGLGRPFEEAHAALQTIVGPTAGRPPDRSAAVVVQGTAPAFVMRPYGEAIRGPDTSDPDLPVAVNEVELKTKLPAASLYIKGSVARIKIHSGKENVLTLEVVNNLSELFNTAEKDPRVKTIFLEGEGEDFLTGPDINFLVRNLENGRSGLREILDYVRRGLRLLDQIDESKKQVVAVVDGLASGSGFELALAADEIITTERALFTQPETRFGIFPMFKGGYRILRRVEYSLAFILQMIGDERDPAGEEERGLRIRGPMAYNYGVADYLVESSDVENIIQRWGEGIEPTKTEKRRTERVEDVRRLFSQQTVRGAILERRMSGMYDGVFVYADQIARHRPQTALLYAADMMNRSNNDEIIKILEFYLLTPMVLKGLSGEDVSLGHRSTSEWRDTLFGEREDQYFVAPYGGVILEVRPNLPSMTRENAMEEARRLVERLNEMDTSDEVEDLAMVSFGYPVRDGTFDRIKISRTYPMSPFSIIDETEGEPGGGRGKGTGTKTWPAAPAVRGETTQGARHSKHRIRSSAVAHQVSRLSSHNSVGANGGSPNQSLAHIYFMLVRAGQIGLKDKLKAIEQELTIEQRTELAKAGRVWNGVGLVATVEEVLAELSSKSPSLQVPKSPSHKTKAGHVVGPAGAAKAARPVMLVR